jgi:hypothetical protein
MTERVVDLLEPIEVDDGDRDGAAVAGGVETGRSDAPVEGGPVGQVGERVVLGPIFVQPDLMTEPPAHRHRDPQQHEIQRGETDRQIEVQAVEPGADVRVDRSVGEVDLENPDSVFGRAGRERHVDLNRRRPDRPNVVGVRVQVREPGHDLTVGGIERFVLGSLPEARTIVGEDDLTREAPEPEAQNVVVGDDPLGEHSHRRQLAWSEALADRASAQPGLDRRLGDEDGLGSPLGQAPLAGLGAVGERQDHAQDHDRKQADRGVGSYESRHRAVLGPSRGHRKKQ